MLRFLLATAILVFSTTGAAAQCQSLRGDFGLDRFTANGPDGTCFDAHGATFNTQQVAPDCSPSLRNAYPVLFRNCRLCSWTGGIIEGGDPQACAWGKRYSGGNSALMALGAHDGRAQRITVQNVRLNGGHDGIRPQPNSGGFMVEGVWATNIGDDAIEGDWKQPGTVRDSLFDGVFVFWSATGTRFDGSNRSPVVIEDVLVRMQPIPFKGQMAHGDLFKGARSNLNNRYVLRNVIIEAPGPLVSGSRLDFPPIDACENVTLILGPSLQPPSNLPDCVTVSRDRSIYERAKVEWIEAHPDIDRLPGDPEPAIAEDEPPPPPDPIEQLTCDVDRDREMGETMMFNCRERV